MKRIAAIAAVMLAGILQASGQSFPSKPINVLVPYAAGAPLDITARLVGEHMASTLGQPVIIENVSGAGGGIATGRVAKAAPDGYTLLVHQPALAANVTLFPNQPFDTVKDLASVGLINESPMVLTAGEAIDARTMAEVIAWMKRNDGNIRFAHAGPGSLSHLCAALFSQIADAKVTMIPYRGGTPAIQDTVGGHTDLYCSSAQLAIGQIKAGKLVGFGVTADKRLPPIGEVPTTAEAGYPKLKATFWTGLFAPSSTPKPVIEKLNAALNAALSDPKLQQKFLDVGMTVYPPEKRAPQVADALLREEIAKWRDVIQTNKIEVAN